ncbi:MAG TPA: iron-sulfur cluster assembly accessory protein [Polyangiales bacterium]|nr:iron-sulfur cluster assembly accessory protein [Polyangiales bacterium]
MEPLIVTAVATAQIKRILDSEGLSEQAVKVAISERSPTGFQYALEFVDRADRRDGDLVFEQDGVTFYVDGGSLDALTGTTLDYVDTGFSAGFKFENPNRPKLLEDPIAARVHAIIQDQINPSVASHGGYVQLLDVKDGTAFVQLGGGCQGCGSADATVKQGIQTTICQEVPEIHSVLDVTDHAAGTNPYFKP